MTALPGFFDGREKTFLVAWLPPAGNFVTVRRGQFDLATGEEADRERFPVRYEKRARTAREALRRGELDTGAPEVSPD